MKIGTIKRGRDIGKPLVVKKGITIGKLRSHLKYIWCVCPSCGKGRWILLCQYNTSKDKTRMLCKECNGRVQGKRNKTKLIRY